MSDGMASNYVDSGFGSKERLKDLDHHFFSNIETSAEIGGETSAERKVEGAKPITFLPVLLESYRQDSYVFGINDYFNAKLKLCAVVNVDNALREHLPAAVILPERRNPDIELTNKTDINRLQIVKYLNRIALNPKICLLPFASHQISLINDGDFLLVIVPASLAGVRRVFQNLEMICANMKSVVIGVVVVDANSMKLSQLCYDVINNSIASFLGLQSMVLGHLLSETAIDLNRARAIQFSEETNKLNSAPIELEDIANNVLENFIKLLTQNRTMNVLSQMSDPNDTRHPYLSVSA